MPNVCARASLSACLRARASRCVKRLRVKCNPLARLESDKHVQLTVAYYHLSVFICEQVRVDSNYSI